MKRQLLTLSFHLCILGVVDEGRSGGDLDVDQLWRLLAEHQAKSKAVALEAEDLKQRLAEAEGDNRALRYMSR